MAAASARPSGSTRTPMYGARSTWSMRGPISARGGACADASAVAPRPATKQRMRNRPVNIRAWRPPGAHLSPPRAGWLRHGCESGEAGAKRGRAMRYTNAIRRGWVLAFILVAGPAAALECRGRVVLDRDGDGRAGAHE